MAFGSTSLCLLMVRAMRAAVALLSAPGAAGAAGCALSRGAGVCDGGGDDTAALQAALASCARDGQALVLRAGAVCISQPLTLPSDATLFIEANSTLRAGAKWPAAGGSITPFILARDVRNVSIAGGGTIDGSGAQWWSRPQQPRPRLVVFANASGVRVEGVTLLNAAFWTLLLGGRDVRVAGVRVRAPNFQLAPNTDGIDVAAQNVHISDVDVSNGDDSICIKSPSRDVLVERSIVSAGNGLVVGTAGDGIDGDDQNVADVVNVTFRDIVANDTTFGCHLKFKPPQHGRVAGIVFDNITITQGAAAEARRVAAGDHPGYAIGLHQGNQGQGWGQGARSGAVVGCADMASRGPRIPVQVAIEDVAFRRIRGHVRHAGQFCCAWLGAACTNITLDDVDLDASVDGCAFSHVSGSARGGVAPASCVPPATYV